MALAYTTLIGGVLQSWDLEKGLKLAHVQVTIGAAADYVVGTGFTLDPAKMGFIRVLAVVDGTIRQSNGTIRTLLPKWNYFSSKLMVFEVAATEAITEIETADLAANDVLDIIVIGIG